MNRAINLFAIAILATFIFGCAGSGKSPIAPGLASIAETGSGRNLWGMWHVTIDPRTREAEITPIRNAQFTANVTRLLQPPSTPTNMISVTVKPGGDQLHGHFIVDVAIRHPFPSLPIYRGFDVRGIMMANGSKHGSFDSGLIYANPIETHLINADGWTRWWNPTEFTTKNTLFGFTPGKLAPPTNPTATLNGYKYFADDLTAEEGMGMLNPATRGTFSTNPGLNSRRYDIQFAMSGPNPVFDFNYAVDASWELPDPSFAPTYAIDAFSLSANCQEAYQISADFSGSDAWFIDSTQNGGNLHIALEVADWGALADNVDVKDELSAIRIESFDLGITPVDILPSAAVSGGNGTTSSVFTFDLNNVHPSGLANQTLMVTVESSHPTTYQPQIDGGQNFAFPSAPLASYMFLAAPIASQPNTDGPIVLSIVPDEGLLDSGDLPVKVIGQNFDASAKVLLVKNDNPAVTVPAKNEVVNAPGTQIDCVLNMDSANGAQAGTYNVRVTNQGPPIQSGELADGFNINGPSTCTAVYNTEIASGDLDANSFSFDLAFSNTGLLLAKGYTGGKYVLFGYDATQSGVQDPVVVCPDLSQVYYSIISIDVDDLTQNIIIVSWLKDNLLECYAPDGSFIQEIDNVNTHCINSVDTDSDGSIWTVGHSEIDGTSTMTGYFIDHYTWNSSTGQYVYDPVHSIDASAQLLPAGIHLLDCAVSYGDRRLFLLSESVGSGKLFCYNISTGTPVYDAAHSVSGFFPFGMALNIAGHWLNAADIEIDHSDPTRENCRMLLMTRIWYPIHYGTTFVKMKTDGSVIDTYSEFDPVDGKNPIPQMYYGMAINRATDKPYSDYISCVEHSSFLGSARKYHTYEAPPDW